MNETETRCQSCKDEINTDHDRCYECELMNHECNGLYDDTIIICQRCCQNEVNEISYIQKETKYIMSGSRSTRQGNK